MSRHGRIFLTSLLFSEAVAGCGSGPGAATEGSATESSATESSATESSATETSASSGTETDTGEPALLEPVECPFDGPSLLLDGALEGLVGSTSGDEPALDRVLEAMQTQWFLARVFIEEHVDGERFETELYLDARGGAIVMQSTESAGYVRVEHCELAPLEFFAACAQSFTSECADFANWFGTCTSDGLACPQPRDCGVEPACPDKPVLGPEASGDPSCVWAALRDAESLAAEVSVAHEVPGLQYSSYRFYLVDQSREVGLTSFVLSDIGGVSSIWRCELEPAEFFQACLDAPTPECEQPSAWFHSCVEAPQPCAG